MNEAPVDPTHKRQQRVTELFFLLDELNRVGAKPPWTRSRLHLYVNAFYDVEDGLNSLGFKELQEVRAYLNTQLEQQRAFSVVRHEFSAPPLTLALERGGEA